MQPTKRLPDSEFEIMRAVWEHTPPVTANLVLENLPDKNWKAPTVISFLQRLVEKGFLRTEKNGKERSFFPLVTKEDYLRFETANFIKQYHGNSFASLVNALYSEADKNEDDLDALLEWAKKRRK